MAKTAKRSQEEEAVKVETTVGSVYRALDYPSPDEMERKARLVSTINETIEARGLTQVEAAEIVGMDQPTLSKLLRGRFRSISIEKLADMLNALGRDVTIVVGAMPQRENVRGRTLVAIS